MKSLTGVWLMSLCLQALSAQHPQMPVDSMRSLFSLTAAITRAHISLWDKDIYGPIMLVDPESRELYANMPDNEGMLRPAGEMYTGLLPKQIPISNTDLEWGGLHWAMIRLPLPKNRFDQLELITHELFHAAQPAFGYHFRQEVNGHLDRREGRVFLRLELEALRQALLAGRFTRSLEHLQNALLFRRYRHQLYRGSEGAENQLELLEGLATYTGQMMSGRDKWQWRNYLQYRLGMYDPAHSFVRTFAYETIPVYGFFLYHKENDWNKRVTVDTDLTELFSEAFGMDQRIILPRFIKQAAEEYDGRRIADEELRREISHNARLDIYREKFLEKPHLEIQLGEIGLSFDLHGVIPLDEDEGVVYLSIEIGDHWGTLRVDGSGALMRMDWRWVIVSQPLLVEGNHVTGEGWSLQLNEGYRVEESRDGNYLVTRKQ